MNRADFDRLHRAGKRIHRGFFFAVYRPNGLEESRLGVTVGKKVGSAVARNRIKRLVREYFRLSRALLQGAYDLNIVARKGAADLSYEEIGQTLETIFCEISKGHCHEARAVGAH